MPIEPLLRRLLVGVTIGLSVGGCILRAEEPKNNAEREDTIDLARQVVVELYLKPMALSADQVKMRVETNPFFPLDYPSAVIVHIWTAPAMDRGVAKELFQVDFTFLGRRLVGLGATGAGLPGCDQSGLVERREENAKRSISYLAGLLSFAEATPERLKEGATTKDGTTFYVLRPKKGDLQGVNRLFLDDCTGLVRSVLMLAR
jgi:hypothetical protein